MPVTITSALTQPLDDLLVGVLGNEDGGDILGAMVRSLFEIVPAASPLIINGGPRNVAGRTVRSPDLGILTLQRR
jgi:hypothetical protein